jgi:hypothetical protein
MKHFFHVGEAGRIMNAGTCANADLAIQIFNGYLLVEGEANIFLDYYDVTVGTVFPRPTFEFRVSQDPFRVENIPAGTLIRYPGGEIIVNDGFIEWTAIEPGSYAFHFENFPYLEETLYAVIGSI